MVNEREIENLIEQYLKEKGFECDFKNPNQNVFRQAPRTKEEKMKLMGKQPDFCIYLGNESEFPEIILETKKPNMNLDKTYLQGLDYAEKLGSPIVIIFDGHTLKSFFIKTNETLKINDEEVKEILTKEQYKLFLKENTSSISTISKLKIQSRNELIKVFAFTNNKLRKAGVQIGIERFTEFSNLLFLKLISEDNDIISDEIPEHIKWDSYKQKSGQELFSYINDTVIPSLEKIFMKNSEKTLFSKLKLQDPIVLKQIIKKLDELDLSQIQTDIKGDAFEYFIQKYNSKNKDLGEYFTPRHIVDFLVKLANPRYGEKVYDPFCGTGGILISAFNYILEDLKSKKMLTKALKKDLKENTIYGSEISSTAKVAKMNMILTGDGHSNIIQQDTLKNLQNEKYDVIISNIPFNLEVDISSLYYTLNSTNGNVQALEHIIKSLNKNPEARAFVIVPEAVLNNKEILNTRKVMIDNKLLVGIISLPSGVFLPYTDAKTSILVLQGYNGKNINKCFYAKVKNDGYTLTARRRKKDGFNDLDEILSSEFENLQQINYDEIKENPDYSLLYFKYIKTAPEGYVQLNEIIEEVSEKNIDGLYETITITNKEFYGIKTGAEYWGENFDSVTSDNNFNYKIIKKNEISFNPYRANIGSFGINIQDVPFAVSNAYPVFKIKSPNYLPEYVYLYLKSKEGMEEIKVRSFGSVRQTLRMDDLKEIYIPEKSLEEQKKIVQTAKQKYQEYKKALEALESFDIDE